jgi:hypothetical protein
MWVFTWCVSILFFGATARADLTHRYSSNEPASKSDTGQVVKDSVGKVDAKLKGDGASVADGKLVLKNDEGVTSADDKVSYLEFASSPLPKSGSVSLVIWFSGKETGAFARLLNFSDKEEASGVAFIYLTARNSEDNSRCGISATDAASKTFQDNDRLDDDKPHMVALVVDGTAKKLHMYIDGKEPKPAEDLGDNTLDKVRPVQNWIGRSSFDQDPGLTASIDEVRVYDNALSADEVAAAQKAGPNELPKKQ